MAKQLAFLIFPVALIQFTLKIKKISSNAIILKRNFNHLQWWQINVLAVWKFMGVKRIQKKVGWYVQYALSGSVNRVSINKLHTNKTVGRILTNFLSHLISWKKLLESFSGFFVKIIQVGHVTKSLNQLWRS